MGIGTTAPDASAALDIVSSTKGALLPRVASAAALATPATGLLVFQTGAPAGFYYNAGTAAVPDWQQLATAGGAAGTASNGLTKTGNDVALGGVLAGATAIVQAGNAFSLTGGNVGIGTSSPAGLLTVQGSALSAGTPDQQQLTTGSASGSTDNWQSFTAGTSGSLTQIDMRVASPTGTSGALGTLSIYAGQGTGGTLLTTQAIVFNNVFNTYQQYPLATPVAVVVGQPYTYRFQTPTLAVGFVSLSASNPYAGGVCSYNPAWDLCFKTYVVPPVVTNVLTAQAGGNVGIGTASPGQRLEVAGQVYSSTGGFRFPDNTLQATAATTTTASNGLTKTGNDVALGGTLAGAVTIAQAGNAFSLTGGNVGIGTGSPGHPLAVQASGGGAMLGFYTSAGADKYNWSLTNGGLNLSESNVAGGRLFVQDGGNVGIGTTTPTQQLDVAGGILARGSGLISNQGAYLQWNRSGGLGETWLLNQKGGGSGGIFFGASDNVSSGSNTVTEWARFDSNGNLGLGTTSPGQKLTVIGQICASGGLNCTSDGRYKRDVVPVPGALASVLRLRGVTYYWKQAEFPEKQFSARRQLGFIAQEIEPYYPEMVTTDADGYKSVDYSRLTPVLVEALKEQQAQIEVLKREATEAKAAAAAAEAKTDAATTKAAAAEAQAAQATATLETFEARLRRLEAGTGGQAQR